MLGLNFVNQIIVGGLGALAIAAVGFANSLTFILVITLSALGVSDRKSTRLNSSH